MINSVNMSSGYNPILTFSNPQIYGSAFGYPVQEINTHLYFNTIEGSSPAYSLAFNDNCIAFRDIYTVMPMHIYMRPVYIQEHVAYTNYNSLGFLSGVWYIPVVNENQYVNVAPSNNFISEQQYYNTPNPMVTEPGARKVTPNAGITLDSKKNANIPLSPESKPSASKRNMDMPSFTPEPELRSSVENDDLVTKPESSISKKNDDPPSITSKSSAAIIMTQEEEDELSAAMMANDINKTSILINSLLGKGQVNSIDKVLNKDGKTLLSMACECEFYEIAKMLLMNKADSNHVLSTGYTALHLACASNNIKIIELLLDNDADVLSNKSVLMDTPLHVASLHNNKNIINILLKHYLSTKGAKSIDIEDSNGRTPLQIAAYRGSSRAVSALLKHGADPLLKAKSGEYRGSNAKDLAKNQGLNLFTRYELWRHK